MNDVIRAGLMATQKRLPSALLYDDLGSVLFEAITLMPEYEVARVDARMLKAHVGDALLQLTGPLEIIELGPGHGRKARVVLNALVKRQTETTFIAVDVSASALEACQSHLEDLQSVTFSCIEDTFINGLKRVGARPHNHRRLVLFLGSNLSNFDRHESQAFFHDVRAALQPGDALLLSTDFEKPASRLLPAYDDALGITAAFNKNVLVRLNRELGADFDVTLFEHEASWNIGARRVEMHLRATEACDVRVEKLGLDLHLAQGETIWTESSHRFNIDELRAWGRAAGLKVVQSWVDAQWPLGLTLFVATEEHHQP